MTIPLARRLTLPVLAAVLSLPVAAGIGDKYCTPAVANTTGEPGKIEALGSPKVAANDLTLIATDLPLNMFGIFVASATQDFLQPPQSDGPLCLGAPVLRFTDDFGFTGLDGMFSMTVDLTNLPGNNAVQGGDTWNFQAWYRDAPPSLGSNFTDAVSITFE